MLFCFIRHFQYMYVTKMLNAGFGKRLQKPQLLRQTNVPPVIFPIYKQVNLRKNNGC